MRILAMSDIHDKWPAIVGPVHRLPEADLCIIAGDLTNMGVFRPAAMMAARLALEALCKRYPHVLWVPGNHDFGVDSQSFPNRPNLHCLLDAPFPNGKNPAGIRGISLTVAYNMPSLAYTWCHMTTDREVERRAFDVGPCDILVSHSPPYGCCDNDGIDLLTKQACHIGSSVLVEWIEKHQPQLVICGHSHGGAGEAMVGKTRVVNVARRWELLDV